MQTLSHTDERLNDEMYCVKPWRGASPNMPEADRLKNVRLLVNGLHKHLIS